MAAYTVKREDRIIVRDFSIALTPEDQETIQFYINAGYVIRPKSKDRSITKADILAAIANYSEENKKFQEIYAEKKFFGVRKWFMDLKKEQAQIEEKLKTNKDDLKEYQKVRKEKGFFAGKKWFNDFMKQKEKESENK